MTRAGMYDSVSKTFIATEAINQYAVVVYNTSVQNGVSLPAAEDARQIAGISQDDATASGDPINVISLGRSWVRAYASANIGDLISPKNTIGEVHANTFNSGFTTGDGIVGHYEEAPTASGDYVIAYINPREVVK